MQSPPGPGFFRELLRRRVVRVAVVYAVVGLGVVEAADLLFPRLGLPDWSVTLAIALALVGFPLVLVLAWAFQATPGGVVRDRREPSPGALPWLGPAGMLALAGAVTAAGVGGLMFGVGDGSRTDPVAAEAPTGSGVSIAVLPFANFSPDPDGSAHIVDGLHDELLTHLSRIPSLEVRSRTSVERYRERTDAIGDIAAELGVTHVLEGSVRHTGERFRWTVQLIDADSDQHLWSESYGREYTLENLFEVEAEVTRSVARILELRFSLGDSPLLSEPPTDDLEAYDLLLRGFHEWSKFTAEGMRRAVEAFEAALGRDPELAEAWHGLAMTYEFVAANGLWEPGSIHETTARARRAARRAGELDPRAHGPHNTLALVHLRYDRDREAAERAFRRAHELAGTNLGGPYHVFLQAVGSPEEAAAFAERMVQAEPTSALNLTEASRTFFFARRFDRAVAVARRAVELDPGRAVGHWALAGGLLGAGRYEEALEAARRGEMEGSIRAWGFEVAALAALGREAEAREVLERRRSAEAAPANLAIAHTALGEHDAALDAIERAVEERSGWVLYLGVHPLLDPLRRHSRFRELLREVGL